VPVINVTPRASQWTALYLFEGITVDAIRQFDDRIDVGHREGSQTALAWILVPTAGGDTAAHYEEWLVRDDLGDLRVLGGEDFRRLFAPADAAAAAEFRDRLPLSASEEAQLRLVTSLAESLRNGEARSI